MLATSLTLSHYSPTIGPKPAWTAGSALVVVVVLAMMGLN